MCLYVHIYPSSVYREDLGAVTPQEHENTWHSDPGL